jgi:hypothetical protein
MRFRGCSGLSHGFDEQLTPKMAIILFRYRREREGSFLFTSFRASCQKVGRSHPRFGGPERMFDGLTADAHAIGRAVQPLLHRINDGLVLPTLYAALLSGRALGLERAARAFRRPVAVQVHLILDRRIAPGQQFSGRTPIRVVFRYVIGPA